MEREIPGSIDVEGREFFYIEVNENERFEEIIENSMIETPEIPMPTFGGIIEEKVRLVIHGKMSLLGISYKGDLQGWRGKLQEYCLARNRNWGIVSEGKLILSNTAQMDLSACEVIFDE